MSNSDINSFIENEDLLLSCTFSDQSDFPYLTEQSSCSLNPSSFLSIQQNEAKEIKDEIDFNIFDILQQQDPDIARVLESVASENPVLLPQLSENSTNLILQDDTKSEPNQIVSLAESDDREIIEMKNLNPVTLTPSMPIPSRVSMRLIKKKKTFADEIYEEPKRPRGKNNKVLRLNKRKISIDDDEELYKKNLDENSTDDFFENLYDEDSCSMYSYDSKMGYKMRKRIDSKDFDPIKKESNKEAATRYRIKKSNERDSLFQTKVNLEKDNDKIRQKIELVQIEISYLKNMLVQTLLNKGVLKEDTVCENRMEQEEELNLASESRPSDFELDSGSNPKSATSPNNCIFFYGVTYLGCASVNAPKSENEINRIINTLNEQGKVFVEITMSVPQTIDDKIVLLDNQDSIIAEYKMSHVLFVVRGAKNTPESNCFAFTTCHGDSSENYIFSCHVFRCKLIEAVSKILYSFWTVFNRQNQQLQSSRQHKNSETSLTSTAGQLSSVATSLLGSLTNIGSTNLANLTSQSSYSLDPEFCEYALKYVNGNKDDQYVFSATLEIKEEDPKNQAFQLVPKEKEFFKLRKNVDKQINIQIQQINNQALEIERCFGVLMCQGRNVSNKDMQLLDLVSMGKSTDSNNTNKGYVVTAKWQPSKTNSALQVLNEETQKNARVFMTIAVDLVINGLQDPVRFCIETKARIFSQNEKFWVYQKNKHVEYFFLQLNKNKEDLSSTTNTIYSLHSIHSQTELMRKKYALEHEDKLEVNENVSDDENDVVMSGLGNVSKDCAEEELIDWSDLLTKWRKSTWNEKPRGLQALVRKGIPEALRGEVWQLLAGCNENEKSMNESYRLLLSKDSSSESVILRDINRTFPGHQFFQDENGQQALYKICKAYSIYDEEVGYCQGLSFLVASLLLHMPEEQAFNLLVKIMYKYEIREIFKTNFECLHLRFFQLESLIKEFLPELNEHFIDLNIESHMYASQWFLTLYTAKFPLFMVFHILDLFLSEGIVVVFSVALSLLKASQRDLLALDFEGVLKYFRVNLPKKYRNEQNFKDLLQIWLSLNSKINEKKLKKLEKKYQLVKEAEALREDPSIRYEKEYKRLTQLNRRLEQENDELANEYIENKLGLSKQLEELRDDYEIVKAELLRYKTDYQNNLNEINDTNKKLKIELDQIKQLWRMDNQKFEQEIEQFKKLSLNEKEKYESEIERNSHIINDYKQICNSLSSKVEKWTKFKKNYNARMNKLNLCEQCLDNNKIDDEDKIEKEESCYKDNLIANLSNSSSSSTDLHEQDEIKIKKFETNFDLADTSLVNMENDELSNQELKIKNLELELARVKLELVDAQCKNQEFDHKLKSMMGSNPESRHGSITAKSMGSAADNLEIMSASTTSINSLSGNNNSPANGNNSWLSKTLTQFKEATNQVVQKAQKSKSNVLTS